MAGLFLHQHCLEFVVQKVAATKVVLSLFSVFSLRTCGKQLCWYSPISRIWRTVCLQQRSLNTSPWAPSKTTPGTYSPAVHLRERGKRDLLVLHKQEIQSDRVCRLLINAGVRWWNPTLIQLQINTQMFLTDLISFLEMKAVSNKRKRGMQMFFVSVVLSVIVFWETDVAQTSRNCRSPYKT